MTYLLKYSKAFQCASGIISYTAKLWLALDAQQYFRPLSLQHNPTALHSVNTLIAYVIPTWFSCRFIYHQRFTFEGVKGKNTNMPFPLSQMMPMPLNFMILFDFKVLLLLSLVSV